ncbi:hypothetical protein [Nannocystis pusilla]|uniref:hypothetical protein n=1 Tax=Nannocystis pusilla TaxID=889268 RepID=UPI003BF10506
MPSRAALLAVLVAACSRDASLSSPAPAPSPAPGAPVAAPQAREHWLGLEPGRHTAVPFAPSLPAELGDVQMRFAQAMASQQSWLQQYLADLQLPPGSPLPYHPNFAITEAEYHELTRAYQHPIFAEGERRDLEVQVEGDALRFAAAGPLAPLARLAIEADGRVRYDDVVVDRPERVEDLAAQFGAWSGFSWRRDASSPSSRRLDVFDLELGRVAGRRFLHLARRRGDATGMAEDIELLAWID